MKKPAIKITTWRGLITGIYTNFTSEVDIEILDAEDDPRFDEVLKELEANLVNQLDV